MTTDDREIVSALRLAVADKVGQERFDLWFGAETQLDYNGDALRISTPSSFFLDWIRANFRRHVEAACVEVLGVCPTITFELEAASAVGKDNAMGAASVSTVKRYAPPPQREAVAPAISEPAQVSTPASSTGAPRRRFASLETFVASETNRLADRLGARWSFSQPGQHHTADVPRARRAWARPICWKAFGPPRESRPSRTFRRCICRPSSSPAYFLEALRGSGLPNFRQ